MLARLNLTALVAALALIDLVVDRLITRLFFPSAGLGDPSWWAFELLARFVSHLAGTLALLVFATSFVGLIRRRELFPRSLRMVTSVLALFFVVLFASSLSDSPTSTHVLIQLRTCQAFLAWMMMLALWREPIGNRAKLGATLFLLPAVFHTVALFVGELAPNQGALAGQVARAGELIAFLAAGFAPLLLPRSLRAGGALLSTWLAGALAVAGVALLAAFKFDLLQVLTLYGLRFELPALSVQGGWAYLLLFHLAVFGVVTAVLPGLRAGGGDRLIAYGVVMVVTAGYQIASPPDLAVATAGLLAIGVGLSRRGAVGQPPETSPPVPAPLAASA